MMQLTSRNKVARMWGKRAFLLPRKTALRKFWILSNQLTKHEPLNH